LNQSGLRAETWTHEKMVAIMTLAKPWLLNTGYESAAPSSNGRASKGSQQVGTREGLEGFSTEPRRYRGRLCRCHGEMAAKLKRGARFWDRANSHLQGRDTNRYLPHRSGPAMKNRALGVRICGTIHLPDWAEQRMAQTAGGDSSINDSAQRGFCPAGNGKSCASGMRRWIRRVLCGGLPHGSLGADASTKRMWRQRGEARRRGTASNQRKPALRPRKSTEPQRGGINHPRRRDWKKSARPIHGISMTPDDLKTPHSALLAARLQRHNGSSA